MLVLRETTNSATRFRGACGCNGKSRHLIVVEPAVDWAYWAELFGAETTVLVARREDETAERFADRVVARLRERAPACALLALGAECDRETMSARARIGRALAVAMTQRGGALFVAASPEDLTTAAALADVLGSSAPANVRVACMPSVAPAELHAA